MHTLETVSEGSWGRPRRLYPESVITNYQEKALRRSLSLLLLAGANALHASRHYLHLHQSSAVAYQLSYSHSPFSLSLFPSLSLLPLSTPLYLVQLYLHLVFFNFISWWQKKREWIYEKFFFSANFQNSSQLSKRQLIFIFFLILQFSCFLNFFSLMARLAHCGLTETWCFRI